MRQCRDQGVDGLLAVSPHQRRALRRLLFLTRFEGIGLPAGFDPTTSKRLGSRLVNALAKQLGAELTRPVSAVGSNFTLLIPLDTASGN
jgi:two-component sensor histidine kinase